MTEGRITNLDGATFAVGDDALALVPMNTDVSFLKHRRRWKRGKIKDFLFGTGVARAVVLIDGAEHIVSRYELKLVHDQPQAKP